MLLYHRFDLLVRFLGDVAAFVLALWLTLLFRHLAPPSSELFLRHLEPFAILFVVWIVVFVIAGLYNKQTIFFRSRLPQRVILAQLSNVVIAALFFFAVPYFAITPKTILVIYLVVSSLLIVGWRFAVLRYFVAWRRENAILVARGQEMDELVREVSDNPRYGFSFVETIDLDTQEGIRALEGLDERLVAKNITFLVLDTRHKALASTLPIFYELVFLRQQCRFVEMTTLYEELFDRLPVSQLDHGWFLGNVSARSRGLYSLVKRVIDLLGGLALGALTVVVFPVVAFAIKAEDRGPIFIFQRRTGRGGTPITVYKFRTMQEVESGVWLGESRNKVTRVGAVLRKMSIDEFPQFLNVLGGQMSLIGPRNDLADIAERIAAEIPYFNVRHVVPPGLSGWAQINQQYPSGNTSPQSLEDQKIRLAYDFYYIKRRSLWLDAEILLKTLRRVFFR